MGMNAVGKSPLSRFLPPEINGWRAAPSDALYDTETIFSYIDGAGEVYLAYNFRSLLARRYSKEGQSDLIADFFDMGSAADAFGVFTHDLEGEEVAVGQGGVYKGGLLSFWKDRYFISLYAEGETSETRQDLRALSAAISRLIPQEGKKPVLLSLLPRDYDPKTARFFHNHLILNYHFFVSIENILLLDQKTEAVLCSSGAKPNQTELLIIHYPNPEAASRARQSFVRTYMPDVAAAGVVQTEDKNWTAVENWGELLAVVFGAASAEAAQAALGAVAKRMNPGKS